MKPNITIIVVPKFQYDYAEGGAENICRIISIFLSKHANVTVLYGEKNKEESLDKIKYHSTNLKSINAFYVDEEITNEGEISPNFTTFSKNIIKKSQLILSFERTLKNVSNKQICVLGGIAYKHCKEIAKSKYWNKLIVPSNFIKQKCKEIRGNDTNIFVVPNGINVDNFFPTNTKKTNVILLPFRADIGKGYIESIDFTAKLNELKKWGKYKLIITKQENNLFVENNIYKYIDNYAISKNVEINYVKWQKNKNMNTLYNKCDFVLSLGNLEEGFGLTTIECILSGRPVIAKKIGATKEILPDSCGLYFAKEPINSKEIARIMNIINKTDIISGRKYIKQNYNLNKMQNSYLNIITKAIQERGFVNDKFSK